VSAWDAAGSVARPAVNHNQCQRGMLQPCWLGRPLTVTGVSVGCCSLGGSAARSSLALPDPLLAEPKVRCKPLVRSAEAPSPAYVPMGGGVAGASLQGAACGAEHQQHQFLFHWGPPQPSSRHAPGAPGRLSFPALVSLGGQSGGNGTCACR